MGIFKTPRATTVDRMTIIPEEGELIYDTDEQIVYYGDGVTLGGIPCGAGGGEVEGVAGENIPDYSVVVSIGGLIYLADNTNPAHNALHKYFVETGDLTTTTITMIITGSVLYYSI